MSIALPDSKCHQTGWRAAFIDGAWRVGMDGNLDTRHDASVSVSYGPLDHDEGKQVAEWLARTYNTQLRVQKRGDQGLRDLTVSYLAMDRLFGKRLGDRLDNELQRRIEKTLSVHGIRNDDLINDLVSSVTLLHDASVKAANAATVDG